MDTKDRINLILFNKKFNYYLAKNNAKEAGREFCLHNLEHFLDVARIAYIINLEKNLNIEKDIIYAAALLHDIGKWQQYETGACHAELSSSLCIDILKAADFNSLEIDIITDAIRNHRHENNVSPLSCLLYRSDKLSRKCYACGAFNQCNWSDDKKNKGIAY